MDAADLLETSVYTISGFREDTERLAEHIGRMEV